MRWRGRTALIPWICSRLPLALPLSSLPGISHQCQRNIVVSAVASAAQISASNRPPTRMSADILWPLSIVITLCARLEPGWEGFTWYLGTDVYIRRRSVAS